MGSLLRCFVNSKQLFIILFSVFVFRQVFAKEHFEFKKITLDGKTLVVEVAQTPEQHEQGLMFRKKLKPDEGMLFIFQDEQIRFFWMKNTLIDLSIGYFNKEGVLVDIKEMKAGKGLPDFSLPSYPSAAPAKYALEMNKGWFARNKIKIGSKLKVQ